MTFKTNTNPARMFAITDIRFHNILASKFRIFRYAFKLIIPLCCFIGWHKLTLSFLNESQHSTSTYIFDIDSLAHIIQLW